MLFSATATIQSIEVNGIDWTVDNETYTTNTTLSFYTINPAGSYIIFNATDFNLSSTNDIDITIMYLHEDPTTSSTTAEVLDFYANTTAGTVTFTIGGFKTSTDYTVKRGGTTISSPTTDSDGNLTFTNDVWSTQHFEIFENSEGEEPPVVSNPYPANQSTEVARPPTNLSAHVNGTNIEVYFYVTNMTGTTDSWTLVESWTGDRGNGRFEYTYFDADFNNHEFDFGNTTYTWTVNATNGSVWTNQTYTYTTEQTTTGGANARYDVDASDEVTIQDAIYVWNYRYGQEEYNRIYDVNENVEVNIQDVIYVWNGRE